MGKWVGRGVWVGIPALCLLGSKTEWQPRSAKGRTNPGDGAVAQPSMQNVLGSIGFHLISLGWWWMAILPPPQEVKDGEQRFKVNLR